MSRTKNSMVSRLYKNSSKILNKIKKIKKIHTKTFNNSKISNLERIIKNNRKLRIIIRN